MTEQRVIQTSRSADLVTFRILVEGRELAPQYQVQTIVVEKELNRIPWAKIILLDGDPAAQDFPLSNTDFFVPGKEIEIKAGYHSDDQTIFKGIVIKHNLKIRPAQAFLIVECRDKAVKLSIGRKSKYFYESKDSEILETIIDSYSLEKEVETTQTEHAEMVQYDVSDWDFLVTRAQANGKICSLDDGKISVKSPDFNQAEVASVSYGATLLDFDAEIDARNQFSTVTSYGWDAANQEMIEMEASDAPVNINGNLSTSTLASVINLDNLQLKNGGSINEAALQEWANAKTLFNQLSKTRGKVKFQGIPQVKPDTTIVLAGVGDRFNGKAYISAVRHQISEGNWTIDAQFGINPKWFTETTSINNLPASGLLAAVNGLQVGKVTQLADDPNGEDRILIRMPVIDNNEQGIWARVSTLDAGLNRGSFFRPEIDDEVIVGFINGNPNDAVVLGMMNSSVKPAPIVANDDNHEKGFITRSEMKFIFNDDLKSMVLETPNGNKITINDDSGSLELEDENNNKIKLNADGISLESASNIQISATNDVKIEGTNIELTASAEFKAEGSARAEISAGGTMVIRGGIVQIN